MAQKKVLVGVIGANGIIVPEAWNPGDTLIDQDGNVITSGGGSGGYLGRDEGGISLLGPVGPTVFASFVYPVGTKIIKVYSTNWITGTVPDTEFRQAVAIIDLVTGGNQLEARYVQGTGIVATFQATVTPPAVISDNGNSPLRISTWTPGTRNIQFDAQITAVANYSFRVDLEYYSG